MAAMNKQYSNIFSQFYQPVVNIKDGGISHYEVLLRPQDESKYSALSIFQYIMSIEKTGEIELLDRWNINEMARKMESPFHAYGFPCSINLSPLTIQSNGFLEYLNDVMSKMKHPERLHFEITETSEILDYKKVNDFISMVKTFGSEVAMDDFGTGFANLESLKQLDVDIIKIDQMYVRDCLRDVEHRKFISDTVDYAKEHNKKVVAEFVEDPSIEKLLLKMGVDCGQGYLYGKAEKKPESYISIQSNIQRAIETLGFETRQDRSDTLSKTK